MNSFSSSSQKVQVKNMEQWVKHAEKHLGEMCSLLGSYTRKTARLRDKADLLVAQLHDFSNTEGPEFQTSIRNLAEDLAMVQDYRQAQVERLEMRVVSPLRSYADIIKNQRLELKKFNTDLSREMKELQKLDRIRLRNPADRQSIAEVSAQKASNNAQRSIKQLEETFTNFHRQKLEDFKMIFTDFVTVEMLFHAKALEVYTNTYHNLEAMDIDKDLELFSGRLRLPDAVSTSSTLMSRYPTSVVSSPPGQSLRSVLAASTGPGGRRPHSLVSGGSRSRSRSVLQRQRGVDEEEEEEEEQEEEDEEEEQEMSESEVEDYRCVGRQSYAAQYAQMRRWQQGQ